MTKEFGIIDYPSPSGGCLLTDIEFTKRMRDLMKYKPDFPSGDVQFLKSGRHFRLTPEAKLVVGRNEEGNRRLLNIARDRDIIL